LALCFPRWVPGWSHGAGRSTPSSEVSAQQVSACDIAAELLRPLAVVVSGHLAADLGRGFLLHASKLGGCAPNINLVFGLTLISGQALQLTWRV
jgi:hypothetical protein